MKLFGLLGHPVRHSFSPALINTLARQQGWDLVYAGLNVSPPQLGDFFRLAAKLPVFGMNVTAPHKRAVLTYCARVSETASLICAANVLVLRNGTYVAENTDVSGFLYGLQQLLEGEIPEVVLVLGAGGAARAVVLALKRAGAKEILIATRSEKRAREWKKECPALLEGDRLSFVPLQRDLLASILPRVFLVVQTTPVGTWPDVQQALDVPLERLPEGACVYDLVYNPVETAFLRRARKYGLRVLGGLPMLAAQAVEALRIWGYDTSVDQALAVLSDLLKSVETGGELTC